MLLRVGLTSFTGGIEEYARRFDVLELRADPVRLPPARVLRRMKGGAAGRVAFSVLVPADLTKKALEAPGEMSLAVEAAAAVEASFMILQTGPTVGPSERVRTRLEALVKTLERPGLRIGWEPRGPFEPEQAADFAQGAGITLVEDRSQADSEGGGVVYTRLRAEGAGARLTSGALERLAMRIITAEEVWVIVEGRPTPKARARIRQAVQALADEAAEFADEDADSDETEGEGTEGEEADELDGDDEEFDDEDEDSDEDGEEDEDDGDAR
jgi:uncharacterized protein YecE (DUF72 family)